MAKLFRKSVLLIVLAAAIVLSSALSLLLLVPVKAEQRENAALGKTAVFKSLDMSDNLKMYNYSPPENIGGNGTIADGNKNVLTDGDPEWGMGNANCTEKNVVGWIYLDLGQEYVVDGIGVSFFGEYFFEDVVIQVSTSADFSENVSTVLATSAEVLEGADKIYEGGELFNDSGVMPGFYKGVYKWYVQSVSGKIHDYNFAPRAARYVRLTNQNNEHAKDANTVLSELEVYAAAGENFAPAPTLFPGRFTYFQDIELSVPYPDAEIYYTTDGSFPCRGKDLYTGPVLSQSLPANFTLRTAAKLSDGSWTNVGEYEYVIDNVALTRPAEFKSLDMSETLDMYCYFPDGNTGNGSVGCYPMSVGSGCSLTNGSWDTWMNYQTNSTWKDTVGWAFIDFGASYTVNRLGMTLLSSWVFGDLVVQLSDDPAFEANVTTVLANTTAPIKAGDTVIYDGAQVNVAESPLFSGDRKEVYANSPDVLTYFDFEEVTARYARLTNRCTNSGGDNNTVFVEIQFYSAEHDKNFEAGVVSINTEETEVASFANGTGLKTILDAMPSTATVRLHDGTELENVALSWSCSEWKENTAGEYEFTSETVGLQNVANACEYSITITIERIKTIADIAYKGGPLFTSDAYPTAEDFTVTSEAEGKLTIAEGTLKEGKNIISWTFTPDDANYAAVKGVCEVDVAPVTLTEISVTVQPAKTEYVAGDSFDSKGMVVTAFYDDGNFEAVADYTISPQTLWANDTKVIVAYQGKTAEIAVRVNKASTEVKVTYTGAALYTSSAYPTAVDFKTESDIEGVLSITSGILATGENTIAWTYTPDDIDNNTVVTGMIKVKVEAVSLTGIEITEQPDKIEYKVGETFDKTGMVVTAKFNDGSSQVVTDYTVDKIKLSETDTTLTVSYGNVSAGLEIIVKAGGCGSAIALSSLSAAIAVISAFAFAFVFVRKKNRD